MKDDYISVIAEVKATTDNAVLLQQDDNKAWIPRSCLDYHSDKVVEKAERGEIVVLSIRQWIVDKKELEYE